MEGFLRRLKESHKAKTAVTEDTVQSEPVIDEGRRHFMRGAFAAGAIAAIPASIFSAADAEAAPIAGDKGVEEREAIIEKAEALARQAMRTPDVLAAREGKGSDVLMRVLRALPAPIPQAFIRGTKYDIEDWQKRHCVQISYEWQSETGPYLVRLNANKQQGFKTHAQAGYGNGIFFGSPNRFLTAEHVAADAGKRPRAKSKRDLTILNTGKLTARPEQVVVDDPSLMNIDIDRVVSIGGIDPDATADSNGYKRYTGIPMRLSRGFVEVVYAKADAQIREQLCNSFVMRVPVGEGTGVTAKEKPGIGMSGSPVVIRHNGQEVLAGNLIMLSSETDPKTGEKYDLAFFHGIEEVRVQLQEQTRSGT